MADHQCSASVVAGQQPVPATAMDGDQSIRKLHAGMQCNCDGQQQHCHQSGPLRGRQQPGQQDSSQQQHQPKLRPTGEHLSGRPAADPVHQRDQCSGELLNRPAQRLQKAGWKHQHTNGQGHG